MCPNPRPTSETHTYKTSSVYVLFLNYKSIITPKRFVWDIKTQYGVTNDDVTNFFRNNINPLSFISYIESKW